MSKETNNTFNSGMIKDVPDMQVPATAYTDALNATLISGNGNEYILLNDYGNAKIYSKDKDELINYVELSPGFVPIGSIEDRGIWYIASWNPETLEGEIGTYPSPDYSQEALTVCFDWKQFNFDTINSLSGLDLNITFLEGTTDSWKNNVKTIVDNYFNTNLNEYWKIRTGNVINNTPAEPSNIKYYYFTPGGLYENSLVFLPQASTIQSEGADVKIGDYIQLKGVGDEYGYKKDNSSISQTLSDVNLIVLASNTSVTQYTASLLMNVREKDSSTGKPSGKVLLSLKPYSTGVLKITSDGIINTQIQFNTIALNEVDSNGNSVVSVKWAYQYYYISNNTINPHISLLLENIENYYPSTNTTYEICLKAIFPSSSPVELPDGISWSTIKSQLEKVDFGTKTLLAGSITWDLTATSTDETSFLIIILNVYQDILNASSEDIAKTCITEILNSIVLLVYTNYSSNFANYCIKNYSRKSSDTGEFENNWILLFPINTNIPVLNQLSLNDSSAQRLNMYIKTWRYKYVTDGMFLDFDVNIYGSEFSDFEFLLLGNTKEEINTLQTTLELEENNLYYVPINYTTKTVDDINYYVLPNYSVISNYLGANSIEDDTYNYKIQNANVLYNPLNANIKITPSGEITNLKLKEYYIGNIDGPQYIFAVFKATKDSESYFMVLPIFLCSAINKYYDDERLRTIEDDTTTVNYYTYYNILFHDSNLDITRLLGRKAFLDSIEYEATITPGNLSGTTLDGCTITCSPKYNNTMPYKTLDLNYSVFKAELSDDYKSIFALIPTLNISGNKFSYLIPSIYLDYLVQTPVSTDYLVEKMNIDFDTYSLPLDINSLRLFGPESYFDSTLDYYTSTAGKIFINLLTYPVYNKELDLDHEISKNFYKSMMFGLSKFTNLNGYISDLDSSKNYSISGYLYKVNGNTSVSLIDLGLLIITKGSDLLGNNNWTFNFVPINGSLYRWIQSGSSEEQDPYVSNITLKNWPVGDKFNVILKSNSFTNYNEIVKSELDKQITTGVDVSEVSLYIPQDEVYLDSETESKEISILKPEYNNFNPTSTNAKYYDIDKNEVIDHDINYITDAYGKVLKYLSPISGGTGLTILNPDSLFKINNTSSTVLNDYYNGLGKSSRSSVLFNYTLTLEGVLFIVLIPNGTLKLGKTTIGQTVTIANAGVTGSQSSIDKTSAVKESTWKYIFTGENIDSYAPDSTTVDGTKYILRTFVISYSNIQSFTVLDIFKYIVGSDLINSLNIPSADSTDSRMLELYNGYNNTLNLIKTTCNNLSGGQNVVGELFIKGSTLENYSNTSLDTFNWVFNLSYTSTSTTTIFNSGYSVMNTFNNTQVVESGNYYSGKLTDIVNYPAFTTLDDSGRYSDGTIGRWMGAHTRKDLNYKLLTSDINTMGTTIATSGLSKTDTTMTYTSSVVNTSTYITYKLLYDSVLNLATTENIKSDLGDNYLFTISPLDSLDVLFHKLPDTENGIYPIRNINICLAE